MTWKFSGVCEFDEEEEVVEDGDDSSANVDDDDDDGNRVFLFIPISLLAVVNLLRLLEDDVAKEDDPPPPCNVVFVFVVEFLIISNRSDVVTVTFCSDVATKLDNLLICPFWVRFWSKDWLTEVGFSSAVELFAVPSATELKKEFCDAVFTDVVCGWCLMILTKAGVGRDDLQCKDEFTVPATEFAVDVLLAVIPDEDNEFEPLLTSGMVVGPVGTNGGGVVDVTKILPLAVVLFVPNAFIWAGNTLVVLFWYETIADTPDAVVAILP